MDFSSSVPDFEEHEKCTLGTFYIDEKNFKSTWIQLAEAGGWSLQAPY